MAVTLEPITKTNLRAVLAAKTAPSQDKFVANNAWSLAQAYVTPTAWPRAIVADGEVVGFLMLEIGAEDGENWLWRLLVAEGQQGRGHGRQAVLQAAEHLRGLGAPRMLASYVPGEGSPQGFYERLGFVPTGAVEDGEVVMALALEAGSRPPGD